jgi:hypothetical protein
MQTEAIVLYTAEMPKCAQTTASNHSVVVVVVVGSSYVVVVKGERRSFLYLYLYL